MCTILRGKVFSKGKRFLMNQSVGVIGLGYVGLPLALSFASKVPTIGFDLDDRKLACYRDGFDPSGEVDSQKFALAEYFTCTSSLQDLADVTVYVVCVPTPVDGNRAPDFGPLIAACDVISQTLCPGDLVVFESTVYPGATEEICIPRLEAGSGLKWKENFCVGYSPERINPGDKSRSFEQITKVVSGDSAATLKRVSELYRMVVHAGVFEAASIRVAEAAKVIENTQRDLNIALINELAMVFHKLEIDTTDVLAAANSKWNFLDFRPGLVGGHCIGVDPYYLSFKAAEVGHHPEIILAARRINESIPAFIASEVAKAVGSSELIKKNKVVNVLGVTFKENCADFRNSKVIDLVKELREFGLEVNVWDPVADAGALEALHSFSLVDWEALPEAAVVIAAVSHDSVPRAAEQLHGRLEKGGWFFDIKGISERKEIEDEGFNYWSL